MQFHMTDGSSRFTFGITKDTDRDEYERIAKSKRPVSTAINVVKRRLGADVVKGLYPIPGKALEGIEEAISEVKQAA